MKLIPQYKLNKSLEKPLLKYRPLRSEIDLFKAELITVLDHIDNSETEEFHKNLVSNFLSKAFYTNTHFINTKGRQDLVIHTGKDNKTKVGVIIEAKRPKNTADWFAPDKPNSKALQELVLYYLRERIEESNIDIKYLVATNINEWYIIEAKYFDNLFFKNKQLVKNYEEWRDGKKVTKDTGLFYNDIAKPFIDSLTDEIPCIYFNIRDHEKALRNKEDYSNKELNALFKILSPYHLLKVPFANDSNELDDKFYKELLHIIGLEEAKEGGKNIIRRKIENRNVGSLIEKAIDELKTEGLHKVPDQKSYGDTIEEQYFNIALELCITWINRILFLKLLEGQLINYHKGDQQYLFLHSGFINDFDELFKLFHKVLAIDVPNRNAAIQQKYSRVPYLNSSLFEISDLEDVTIKINAIDSNDVLEYVGNGTILKEQKKKNERLNTLDYLFQFLEAYDFASEGTGDTQEDNKTLINASVLGKVFEKINGYKDGSIYTPGFITMYMSRQSIRLAVLQKFNEANNWDCKDFADLDNYIEYQQPEARNKANALINDLKLCDPAVGSGHFLVSALNEIIAIKSDLKILQDVNGKRLKEYSIDVVNDELIITDEDNDLFIYNPQSAQSQLIQQTLFSEKQTIIENCLFGVDINPNSVKICRLRLWIELLKNAWYKPDGNLETLPNIDINIKCGNSLLSRFALDADLSKALKSIKYDVPAYRGFVNDYKNCKERETKRGLQLIIDSIKADFRTEISKNDPLLIKLNKASGELYNILTQVKLFEDAKTKKANKLKQEKLEVDINKWTAEIDEIKDNAIYKNAFEWRFEFPEVLNNNGDFEGFDLIIGNPPYVYRNSEIENIKGYFKSTYYNNNGNFDLYKYFVERAIQLTKANYFNAFILNSSFILQTSFELTREFLLKNTTFKILAPLGPAVFDEATVDSALYVIQKGIVSDNKFLTIVPDTPKNISLTKPYWINQQRFLTNDGFVFDYLLNDAGFNLVNRLFQNYPKLEKEFEFGVGINTGYIKDALTSNFKINNTYHPMVPGTGISKYGKVNTTGFIMYDKEFVKQKGKLGRTLPDERLFTEPKILIVRTRNLSIKQRIVATIDYDKKYNLNRLSNIISRRQSSIEGLLGVLNSKLFNWLFTNRFYDYEIKPIYLRNTPLCDTNNSILIELVMNVLKAKLNEQDTSALEQQIDALVYQLYDLTPDEIKIIENETTN